MAVPTPKSHLKHSRGPQTACLARASHSISQGIPGFALRVHICTPIFLAWRPIAVSEAIKQLVGSAVRTTHADMVRTADPTHCCFNFLDGQSSIDGQHMAGYERGGIAGQKQHGVGDVLRIPQSA